MSLRLLGRHEISLVEGLVDRYPFKSYRFYRVLSRQAQRRVMLAEIADTLTHPDGFVVLQESSNGSGFAVGRALAWDSSFFGVSMGRIEYLSANEPTLIPALVAESVDQFRARGVHHLSARVDVADIPLLGHLEEQGFRLMDALATYTTRPRKEPPLPVRTVGQIREVQAGDEPALVQITTDAYRGFRGRFHLDPHVPDERCDEFYVEWARQCLRKNMADTVLVSEGADGQLLGFLAFRRREPVSSVGGVPVFGGGLGACRADVPGAYAGLIRAGTIWAHEHGAVAECQTQNYNFPTIRIYEAVGAHYVRSDYTLHLWIP